MKKSQADEELFSFLESKIGKKLSRKQKKLALETRERSNAYDNKTFKKVIYRKPKFSFLGYGATAIATAIICLSVAIPITMGLDGKSGKQLDPSIPTPPPIVDETKYLANDITSLVGDREYLSLHNFLLFDETDAVYDSSVARIKSEFAKDSLELDLSHTLETYTDNEIKFNQRVRTYKNYLFRDFDIFLTETNELKTEKFNLLGVTVGTDIYYGFNQSKTIIYLYFFYENNEYFFEILTSDIEYVQTVFIPKLFGDK